MWPIASSMWSKPLRRGAMAAFTADTIIDIEFPGLLGIVCIKSMANKALRCVSRISCPKAGGAQDFGDPLRNGVIQHIPGAGVLVLENPSAVLVLQNLRLLACLNRSVTSGSAAGTRTDVAGFSCRNWLQKAAIIRSLRRYRKEKQNDRAESNNSSGASVGVTAQPSIHCADSTPGGGFKVCVLIRSQTIEINSETQKIVHKCFSHDF